MDLVRLLDRLAHARAKHVVVVARLAADAEHRELRIDEPLLHELVQRGHQLALGEIAHRPEDHDRARIGAVALGAEAADRDARARGDDSAGSHDFFTACPPNSLRSAAITLPPNESA